MLGVLKFSGKGRGRAERDSLYGLPVLRAEADRSGFWGERRLRRAGRSLYLGGAARVLAPPDFDRWPLLEGFGLRPVDPVPLVRAQSAALTLELLRRLGRSPCQATVALRGTRADREMERLAAALCPLVRHLVISAPRGGQELARWLRRQYGIPILPPEEGAQVALRLSPQAPALAEASLELYGPRPDLGGLTLAAPALAEEDREDLPLLTALWEGRRLKAGDLKIT